MLKSNFAKISIIFAAIAVLVVGVAIPVSADTTLPLLPRLLLHPLSIQYKA